MKTFERCAAQGDVYFIRLEKMPEGDFVEVAPENGHLIITHSETGHHHTMNPANAKLYRTKDNDYDAVLVIDRPTSLDHQRSFDTHEPILFDTGIFKVRRQREYTPEGYRKVQD